MMHKSCVQLVTSSLPVRKNSTTTRILLHFWQKLRMLPLLRDVFAANHEDVMESTADAQKVSYLYHKYRNPVNTEERIENRTESLLQQIVTSKTEKNQLEKVEELVSYMISYPVIRTIVREEEGIRIFLNLREHSQNNQMKMIARAALIILGYADPVKGKGIRILSLDGGGTRGVISIEILKHLEEVTGQRIHKMFDLIVGTSTGALLAFLIGIRKMPLSVIMQRYKELCSKVFNRPGSLIAEHALYDVTTLLKLVRAEFGAETRMIDTAVDIKTPKVAAVSTLVNYGALRPYVFRNYCLPPSVKQSYDGSSMHRLSEALHASTAAPGYFEECRIGPAIHHDGGLLINNPCALAIHESKRLWPDTPLQTVVSIGTGVYHGTYGPSATRYTTISEKMLNVLASATNVEATHKTLEDLLPVCTYFRFNPGISDDVPFHECNPIVIDQLITDAQTHIDKCDWKYRSATESLRKRKTGWQKMLENNKEQEIMMSE